MISVLAGILFIAGCGSAPTDSTVTTSGGSITGVVATRGSGITVEAQREDGVSRIMPTDEAGRYTLEDLAPGSYRLYAAAPGYSRSAGNGPVAVIAGQMTTVLPILLNWTGVGVPSAQLTGVVTDAETGLPVEGAFVNVACDPNEIICLGRSAFTDGAGRYAIASIPPGFGFDLFIGKTGYPNHLERGNLLGPDQVQTLDVAMRNQ